MNKPINKTNKRSTRFCFGNLEALMLLYLYRPYSRQQLVNDNKKSEMMQIVFIYIFGQRFKDRGHFQSNVYGSTSG